MMYCYVYSMMYLTAPRRAAPRRDEALPTCLLARSSLLALALALSLPPSLSRSRTLALSRSLAIHVYMYTNLCMSIYAHA